MDVLNQPGSPNYSSSFWKRVDLVDLRVSTYMSAFNIPEKTTLPRTHASFSFSLLVGYVSSPEGIQLPGSLS